MIMRGFTGFFGSVSMAALILMGSMARGDEVRPAESAAATSASSKASEVAAKLRQQFMAMYVDVLYDAPKPCVDDCEVPIKLTWTTVDNKDYCLASVPKELTFESSNFKKKQRITWKLDHTDLDSKGRKIEFDENHGIFFIPDGKNQIDAPKRTSQDTFEVTNVHSKVTKVTYLPVILWWTNDPDPQPELCAAGDPIINNK
jgi:hypothetical protein